MESRSDELGTVTHAEIDGGNLTESMSMPDSVVTESGQAEPMVDDENMSKDTTVTESGFLALEEESVTRPSRGRQFRLWGAFSGISKLAEDLDRLVDVAVRGVEDEEDEVGDGDEEARKLRDDSGNGESRTVEEGGGVENRERVDEDENEDVHVGVGEVLSGIGQDIGFFGRALGSSLSRIIGEVAKEDVDLDDDDDRRPIVSEVAVVGMRQAPPVTSKAVAKHDLSSSIQSSRRSKEEETRNEFEEAFLDLGGGEVIAKLDELRGHALKRIRELKIGAPPGMIEKATAQVDAVMKETVDASAYDECKPIMGFGQKSRDKIKESADTFCSKLTGHGGEIVTPESLTSQASRVMEKFKSETLNILAIIVSDVASAVASAGEEESDWRERGRKVRAIAEVGRKEAGEVSVTFFQSLERAVRDIYGQLERLCSDQDPSVREKFRQEIQRSKETTNATITAGTTSANVKLRQCIASLTPQLRLEVFILLKSGESSSPPPS